MNKSEEFSDYQQLIAFINGIPGGVGIYYLYQGGAIRMIYLNDGYYDLIGATREQRQQFTGFSVLEAVPDPYREQLRSLAKAAFDGEDRFQVRIPIHGEDGQERWLQLNGKIVSRSPEKCVAYITYTDVTQSERNVQALARANAEIQMAADSGGILYWVYDVEKRETIITNGKGYGYEQVIENVPEVFRGTGDVHPDEEPLYFRMYEQAAKGEKSCDCYARILNHLIGEYQWQHISLTRYAEGQYVGSSIEVNEQKRTEQRFEDEFALRNDLLKDCILFFQVNLTRNVVEEKVTKFPELSANRAPFAIEDSYWATDNGVLPDPEIAGELKRQFSAPALLSAWNQGKTQISMPPYQMRLSGEIRMAETTVTLMKKPTTGETMAFSYTRDVTDREVNRWISCKLLNEQYEAINVIDCRSGRYALYSFSYKKSAVAATRSALYTDGLQQFMERYIVPEDQDYYRKMAALPAIREALDREGKYSFPFHMNSEKEEKPVKKMTYFYLDSHHYSILSVLEDVTEVSRKEKENVEKLHAALERAELATRAKSEFLSRMSHDMRTPMNGILGMAELSEEETDPAVLLDNIRKIRASGDYLLGLINDTLDFQRIESGKLVLEPVIVSADSILQGILDLIRPMAEKKHLDFRFRAINTERLGCVRADPLRLKQIFVNLLSNAVKFTPEGGIVTLELERLRREGNFSDDRIVVRDTGIGMSETFLKEKLFMPFSQERNEVTGQYAGSGLGLSIVKSLVELMGGRIEAESTRGAGTTFTVYLTFQQVASEEAERAAVTTAARKKESYAELKGKSLLLCEDHPLNAEIAGKLLTKMGCEVTWAHDGREGVSLFSGAAAGRYDAILMDIRMPVMDGLSAARTIRALPRADAAEIPIIAMTANAFAEDIRAALEAGMNAHLAKPIDPAVLYETVAGQLKEAAARRLKVDAARH